jgi:hypothetical protein
MNQLDKICPICQTQSMVFYPVYHHFICAYVGPSYDFSVGDTHQTCPKCKRLLKDNDWEIIGGCSMCSICGYEAIENK